jgi:hypothetical protein
LQTFEREGENVKSKKRMLTAGAVTLVLTFAIAPIGRPADPRTEVEARYGRELLSVFEQMQSGIRAPAPQSTPEASEPEARRLKNDVSGSLDESRRAGLRNGLGAAGQGLRDWASDPKGARIKEGIPLRLPSGE